MVIFAKHAKASRVLFFYIPPPTRGWPASQPDVQLSLSLSLSPSPRRLLSLPTHMTCHGNGLALCATFFSFLSPTNSRISLYLSFSDFLLRLWASFFCFLFTSSLILDFISTFFLKKKQDKTRSQKGQKGQKGQETKNYFVLLSLHTPHTSHHHLNLNFNPQEHKLPSLLRESIPFRSYLGTLILCIIQESGFFSFPLRSIFFFLI